MTTTTQQDVQAAPELAPLNLADKPDGPGAAMMVSAGIGIFVLGLFTLVAEFSTPVKDFLEWWQWGVGVGPLAGKTTLAVLAYFVSLAILWALWRNKDSDLRRAFYIGLGFGLVGALFTFPTFFQMFAAG